MSETPPGLIDSFVQLANLLTLGKENVAVTGNITSDGLMAAIAISSNSGATKALSQADPKQDFDSRFLTPGDRESIDLENPPQSIPSVEQHARDLICIFQHQEELRLNYSKLCRWIVFRCYPELRARLLLGTARGRWETDPIATMLTWTPTEDDRRLFQAYVNDRHGTQNTTLIVTAGSAPLFAKYGLYPSGSDTTKFTFHIDSASKWLKLISSHITKLRELLHVDIQTAPAPAPRPRKKTKLKDRPLKWKPSREALVAVDIWLSILSGVVESLPALKWLFTHSSLKSLFVLNRSPTVQDDGQGMMNDDGQDTIDDDWESTTNGDDNDAMVDDDGVRNLPEATNMGEEFFQDIWTVMSWHVAAFFFITNSKYVRDIKATLITLPDHFKAPITDIDHLKKGIRDLIAAALFKRPKEIRDNAMETFERNATKLSVFLGHVHPEAGLIALAKHSQNQRVDIDASLRQIFSPAALGDTLYIGVVKKCCWMCWQLGQKLFKDDDISVQLPGTHGTVFQWDPPHFGISKEVLQELVDDLKKEIVRLAVEATNESEPGPAQSSPRSLYATMGSSIPVATPDDPQP